MASVARSIQRSSGPANDSTPSGDDTDMDASNPSVGRDTDGESESELGKESTPTPTAKPTSAPPSPTEIPPTALELDTTSTPVSANVLRVIDGDTLLVAFEDGSRGVVELAGVDAPE
ncbi:thermonuclease family protein [Halobium palmae]|uniref:Thermonuclease family protein n=1 Tax=Halobium palmae TaxID=1776492 RepID=A0ABD5RVV1_9EURY